MSGYKKTSEIRLKDVIKVQRREEFRLDHRISLKQAVELYKKGL